MWGTDQAHKYLTGPLVSPGQFTKRHRKSHFKEHRDTHTHTGYHHCRLTELSSVSWQLHVNFFSLLMIFFRRYQEQRKKNKSTSLQVSAAIITDNWFGGCQTQSADVTDVIHVIKWRLFLRGVCRTTQMWLISRMMVRTLTIWNETNCINIHTVAVSEVCF